MESKELVLAELERTELLIKRYAKIDKEVTRQLQVNKRNLELVLLRLFIYSEV